MRLSHILGFGLMAFGCFVIAGITGCEADPPGVRVTVCGDVRIPEDIDLLRISVLDRDRNEQSSGVVQVIECPGEIPKSLPHTIEIPSRSGSVWVVVQGLKNDIEVAHFERRTKVGDEMANVTIGLTRDCLGVECSLGQTCIDGACLETPWEAPSGVCEGTPVPIDEDAVEEQDAASLCPESDASTE